MDELHKLTVTVDDPHRRELRIPDVERPKLLTGQTESVRQYRPHDSRMTHERMTTPRRNRLIDGCSDAQLELIARLPTGSDGFIGGALVDGDAGLDDLVPRQRVSLAEIQLDQPLLHAQRHSSQFARALGDDVGTLQG